MGLFLRILLSKRKNRLRIYYLIVVKFINPFTAEKGMVSTARGVRYGVISDIHENPESVVNLIRLMRFGYGGIDKLVLNGDIGEWVLGIRERIGFTKQILEAAGKSKLETYVQPGSHEELNIYEIALGYVKQTYKNIIDVREKPVIECLGHNLVFIPGSDINGRDESFTFGTAMESGEYVVYNGRLVKKSRLGVRETKDLKEVEYTNIEQVLRGVRDPKNTILFCHCPPKFDNGEIGVDFAHYIETSSVNSLFPERLYSTGFAPAFKLAEIKKEVKYFIDYDEYKGDEEKLKRILREKLGLLDITENVEIGIERKGNKGNVELGQLCNQYGITKMVSSHFHESGHNAHTFDGKPVAKNTFVEDLIVNSGQGSNGKAVIIEVDGERMSYIPIGAESKIHYK